MRLDPTTARAGLRTAREIISGRQISYPIPYVLVILAVLCIGCLIVAIYGQGAVCVVALILASGCFVLLAAVLIVGIFFRPELLRSEHHHQVMRLLDIVGDSEMAPTEQAELFTTIVYDPGEHGRTRWRRGTSLGENHD